MSENTKPRGMILVSHPIKTYDEMPRIKDKNQIKKRLSDQAYEQLRDALIKLEFEPMEPLNERSLSAKMGMGLAPIREALRRLEQERLVTIYPRRGIFAAEINITDQQSIKEIRYELEGLAASLAATRGTQQECLELMEIAKELLLATESEDKLRGDAAFRRQIYAMARNNFLQPVLEMHHNLAMRLWYFCRRQKTRATIGTMDYRPIATAIMKGDADKARRLLSGVVAEHSDILKSLLM